MWLFVRILFFSLRNEHDFVYFRLGPTWLFRAQPSWSPTTQRRSWIPWGNLSKVKSKSVSTRDRGIYQMQKTKWLRPMPFNNNSLDKFLIPRPLYFCNHEMHKLLIYMYSQKHLWEIHTGIIWKKYPMIWHWIRWWKNVTTGRVAVCIFFVREFNCLANKCAGHNSR